MEESEFRRVLELFPVVRSRDYHHESELQRQSISRTLSRQATRALSRQSTSHPLLRQSTSHPLSRQSPSQSLSRQSTSQSLSRKSTYQPIRTETLNEWQNARDERDKKETKVQRADKTDAFWEKLKLASGKKLGDAEAKKFCEAFQQLYNKLVHEELSLEVARSFVNSLRDSNK